MKGLIIKDFEYIKVSKIQRTVIMMMLMFSWQEPYFLAFYMVYLTSMMVSTTFTYDEYEDGMMFLMTTPITKKAYVKSKYALSIGFGAVVLMASLAVAAVVKFVRNAAGFEMEGYLISLAIGLFAAVILSAINIPVIVKYGSEKGRYRAMMIMAILAAAVFGGGVLLGKLGAFEKVGAFQKIAEFFIGLPTIGIVAAAVVVALLVLAISYSAAQKAMEKKEY